MNTESLTPAMDLGQLHESLGRASLSPASRSGRVPSKWSGSPGRTRPTDGPSPGRVHLEL
ncbi:MAG: hypothetical protein FJ398_09125 [Verrucomicrobia bacterium]|nr:hypothetical protein [Verrucomicrobiota bacterium]